MSEVSIDVSRGGSVSIDLVSKSYEFDVRGGQGLQGSRGPAGNRPIYATWASLASVAGAAEGSAEVPLTDTGTHTDPMGGTVSNSGIFRWSTSPAGWVRVADVDALSAKTYRDQAVAAAASLRISHYDDIPGYFEIVLDANGDSRVLRTDIDGLAKTYEIPINGLTPANLGLSSVLTALKLEGYPTQAEIILDTNGDARVVKWLDPDDPTAAVFYGAAGSSAANTGSGAGVYAGSVNGTPQFRRVQSGSGINVFESGNSIVVEAAASSAAPRSFVLSRAMGQSNMISTGGTASLATPLPTGLAWVWDPTTSSLLDLALDTTAKRASMLPAIAKAQYEKTGEGSIFVHNAYDSCSMAVEAQTSVSNTWAASGTRRGLADADFDNCIAWLNSHNIAGSSSSATVPAVCWHRGSDYLCQGEQDGTIIGTTGHDDMTQSVYQTALLNWNTWRHTKSGPKVPLIIVPTAYRTSTNDTVGFQAVRAVQRGLPKTEADIFIAALFTLQFPSSTELADSVHWNQSALNQAGYAAGQIGALVAAGVN